jgi:hypothetical protein
VLASQEVVDRLLDEESQATSPSWRSSSASPIKLQAETLYNQEQYDVVLI